MSLTVLSSPLGNLEGHGVDARRIERIAIRSDDLAKRVLRLSTSVGEIGLRFENGLRLRDGDVVYEDRKLLVAVAVEPDDVLVIRPRDPRQALEIGHALGNRHLPVQFDGDAAVVRYDPLVEELLRGMDVPYAREARILTEPFAHAHAPHAHA